MEFGLLKLPAETFTGRVKDFGADTPPDISHKNMEWRAFRRDPNPAFDPAIERLGPETFDVRPTEIVASRAVIALTQPELDGIDKSKIVGAILADVPWNLDGYPRDRPIRKTLFAVDELCGFIYAVALVRPTKMEGLKASSIKKKLKQKSFAAAVSREDIHAGAELLELPVEQHIEHCITAIRGMEV